MGDAYVAGVAAGTRRLLFEFFKIWRNGRPELINLEVEG